MLTRDFIIYLNKLFRLLTKILGIIIYAYFIFQVQHYQVQWNFLISYFPGMCGNINNFLSTIGTYILILPLVVILTSFLFPEVIWLQIITTIFAIGGGIFGVITSAYQGTLGTFINLRFVTVSHILTLKEKQEMFITQYNLCAAKFNSIVDKFKFFMTHLEDQYFISEYNPILITFNTLNEIESYATSVCTKLGVDYDNMIQPAKTLGLNYKRIIIVTCVVGGLLLIATFYFNVSVDDNLITMGTLQNDINQTASQLGGVLTATAQATLDQSEQLAALVDLDKESLDTVISKLENVATHVKKLYDVVLPSMVDRLFKFDKRVEELSKLIELPLKKLC